MATFRKRNGKWQVQVRRSGSRAISRTFFLKQDAIAWANQEERRLDRDCMLPVLSRNAKHTLGQALERYERLILPIKRAPEPERWVIRRLMKHPLAEKPLCYVTVADLAAYRDERFARVSASTVRRQFNLLRHVFKVAEREWGWQTPYSLAKQIQLPAVRHFAVQRVSDDAISSLLSACRTLRNPFIAPVVRLALATAMRRGEILALRWEDIDWGKRTVRIRASKNGHPRLVPLTPEAISVLGELPAVAELVFPISTNAFRLAFGRVRKAAAAKFRFHDLRHEAISRFFEAGLTMPEVQLISGHRTLSQLTRYSHPDVARLTRRLSSL